VGPAVSERKREKGTDSVKARWAAGSIRYWAEVCPRGPIPFLFCFPSFLFSVSLFLLFWFQFWVLKSFSYSVLNEIRADQLWYFKSVFRN
jgi:hypothetical protein